MEQLWPLYAEKMGAMGLDESAMAAFQYNLEVLVSGKSTMIPESAIGPVEGLPSLDDIKVEPDPSLLQRTLMLKLNGGLGTGMGLDKAKSLLPVTEGFTFLDLIVKQVLSMPETHGAQVAFMLMNSFSTTDDTKAALSAYPDLGDPASLEFLQNKAPKVDAADFTPVSWPKDPSHEWCPPGHGDLYPAMLGSGTLDQLIDAGFQYMFVSNSDNLGATMDVNLLTYFAQSGAPFMMEVADRTEADKKGGHLATDLASGGLLLRESAQCPEEDEKAFQDISKYTYFNTNNLWVDLYALKDMFVKFNGLLPLPVMKNSKTVDPRDGDSTKVVQLETAMGAAIQCFEGATAIKIPRSRFAPVKTTNDLIALRSDAYVLTPDYRIELAPERQGVPPNIKLDKMYKFVDMMDTLTPKGVPSLINCKSLDIEGPIEFAQGVVIAGSVKIVNKSKDKKVVAAGIYEDCTKDVTNDAAAPAAPVSRPAVTYAAPAAPVSRPAVTYSAPVTYAAPAPVSMRVASSQPAPISVQAATILPSPASNPRRIVQSQGSVQYWNQYPSSPVGGVTAPLRQVHPAATTTPVVTYNGGLAAFTAPAAAPAQVSGARVVYSQPATVSAATSAARPSIARQGSTQYWGGYNTTAATAPMLSARGPVVVSSAQPMAATTYAQPMATMQAPRIVQGASSMVTRPAVIQSQGSASFWNSMAKQP